MGKNYYPQLFLEECEYVVEENKISKFINNESEISSDEEVSDEEKIKTQVNDGVFFDDYRLDLS